jgi:hypothetical protein
MISKQINMDNMKNQTYGSLSPSLQTPFTFANVQILFLFLFFSIYHVIYPLIIYPSAFHHIAFSFFFELLLE